MTDSQINRLEHLRDIEFLSPQEEQELRELLRLETEVRAAFEYLRDQGFAPAWNAGRSVVVGNREIHNIAQALAFARLNAAR